MKTEPTPFRLCLSKYKIVTIAAMFLLFSGCSDDEGPSGGSDEPDLTGTSETYPLLAVGAEGKTGTLVFAEMVGGGTLVTIRLNSTISGDSHPAHIHSGTAVEGGPIVIPLDPVDGAIGESVTIVTENVDGTAISYNQLANLFDGHVNVHLSDTQLDVFISQTDVGSNVLTGITNSYPILSPNTVNSVGTLEMAQRLNGQTLISIIMDGELVNVSLNATIDENSAAEDGDVVIVLSSIANGQSATNVTTLVNGDEIQYNQLIDYNGHISITNGAGEFVGLGDIGGNELTTESITYDLLPAVGEDIAGSVLVVKRQNGSAMIQVTAANLETSSTYRLDLLSETAAEIGSILSDLNDLAGATGTVQSTVRVTSSGDRLEYDDIVELDGHIDLSENDGTRIASADIGINELTGESQEAVVEQNGGSGITGLVTFYKRRSGFSLVSVLVEGTSAGASHPIHIHNNSAVERGSIAVDLTYVDGEVGFSETSVFQTNAGDALTYEDLIEYDGYIAIHESDANITNIISLSDIGQNTLTGRSKSYTIDEVDDSGISGTITFLERKNLTTLATMEMSGTAAGLTYPFNIHTDNIIEGGPVAVTLSEVDGSSGLGFSNIRETNGSIAITYDEILTSEFHINFYETSPQLANLKSQADIGSNELTGEMVAFDLGEQNSSGITGKVTILERVSGFSIIKMEMFGSSISNIHPNHIHVNSFETGGGVIKAFTNIVGSPGVVYNHVDQLENGTTLTYEDLLTINGHVIAHVSPGDLTYVAAGNIGINGTPTNGRKLSYAPARKIKRKMLDYGVSKCETADSDAQ
ncbi:MAG: hypothetical protein RIF33_06970 [Cyclobacteriaceae bacterium]